MEQYAREMTSTLYGNPHSNSWSSQRTTSRIEDTRLRLLNFFQADPTEFDLVFVANATAGVKLVVEALRSAPGGYRYAYHQSCHTSLIGVREEATESVCVDDSAVEDWIVGKSPFNHHQDESISVELFAYTAQCHMDGQRYPVSWGSNIQMGHTYSSSRLYTLLDAASLVATASLDLSDSDSSPNFVVLSLYKIFGFPDLGALIVRRDAESLFDLRRYFGGGTVDTVVCGKEQWHAPKTQFLHERLEDGTLPFHNIIALDVAMDVHLRLYKSMSTIASHTSFLVRRLYQGLSSLEHRNGMKVCVLYTKEASIFGSPIGNGPSVAFNIQNQSGAWIALSEFEKLAVLKHFHVRTGGVCCPGGIASALNLASWESKNNFSAGFRCGTENDIISGKPTGIIRISLGAMSTRSDIDDFIAFVDEFYADKTTVEAILDTAILSSSRFITRMQVKEITIYPIKSCGGYTIPPGTAWEVRPEGLAWDREWCLVHRGSGQALSQKRYPQMAFLRTSIDFVQGELRVTYNGPTSNSVGPRAISVPLSMNPSLFDTNSSSRAMSSKVCGDVISAQKYASPEVNLFFSESLGVPCVLARFPPGGIGLTSRFAKAQIQRHQLKSVLGTSTELPTPPDSDSEQQKSKILLSNESPILVINTDSLAALNRMIHNNGGEAAPATAFRANIVIGPEPGTTTRLEYAEDNWARMTIGNQLFQLLGACRRCQMVCVNQENGQRNQEPFVTLSKTRRFDGRVYFGVHMRHTPHRDTSTREMQHPTIRVGDAITVEGMETSGENCLPLERV
jgi:molybdenum cofactor sulfurtransferase